MPRYRLPLAVLACAAWLCPGAAAAHAVLMESHPAAGAATPPGAATLSLRFNSRIDHARSRLVLRHGKTEAALPFQPTGAGDVLAASVALTPGAHVLRWQVLALDGHITRGEVAFTVGER